MEEYKRYNVDDIGGFLYEKVEEKKKRIKREISEERWDDMETGNYGVALYQVNNMEGILFAHSQVSIVTDSLAQSKEFVPIKEEKKFETLSVNRKQEINGENSFDREVDTESKLLEEIAFRIEHEKKPEGTVMLYTDRYPCISCEFVIKEFKEMFSEINICVYYKYKSKRRGK